MSSGKTLSTIQNGQRKIRRTKQQNVPNNKTRSIILQDDCDKMKLPLNYCSEDPNKSRTKTRTNKKTSTVVAVRKISSSTASFVTGDEKPEYSTKYNGDAKGVDSMDLVVRSAQLQNRHSYTFKPIIPARKKELISVAKAMHREAFAPRVKKLFERETNAALNAVESGIYIGWRCPEFTWDCIRLDNTSRCFCDHALEEHEPFNIKKMAGKQPKRLIKCLMGNCSCKSFNFIPQRPEDIGEWWLRKRPGFDGASWRAKCRCKHTHIQHNPASKRCKIAGCSCFRFESNFLCAACDWHLENHETFFEDTKTRQEIGLPCGQHYLPFNELPDLRKICLSGGAPEDSRRYEEIALGPYSIPPTSKNKSQRDARNRLQFRQDYR